jgi:transcriptional regulator with XRE-family HTH domain
MLTAGRRKTGLTATHCAKQCHLSQSFLSYIEKGQRAPELERVPMIAYAYKVPPAELCWAWVVEFAPSSIPHLAVSVNFDANPVLRTHLQQQYAGQQEAQREAVEARKAEQRAARAANRIATAEQASQVARVMARRTKPTPAAAPVETVVPFVEVPTGGMIVGPRGGQPDHRSTLPADLPDATDLNQPGNPDRSRR